MGYKKRKCKTCGRPFSPKAASDRYCSDVCRTTGCFMSGGGDRTKPMSREMLKAAEKQRAERQREAAPAAKVKCGREQFPRVHKMFELPVSERYAISRTFTPEEAECARRLARKMLMDERKIDSAIDFDESHVDAEPLGSYDGIAGGRIGDSDDGTV